LRRTANAMQQGDHRFERGQNFVETGEKAAKRLGVSCGWFLDTVPNAAHNDRQMSGAAVVHLVSDSL